MAKVQERRVPAAAASVLISYPKEGECITSPGYTFRSEGVSAAGMEIAIDQNEWLPCREAEGYWWFDWAGYQPGKHQAVVRMQARSGGKTSTSRATRFQVEFSADAVKLPVQAGTVKKSRGAV